MKYIFLRILYNLSERALLEQVLDSRSFSKFVGINTEEDIPSRRTLRRFIDELKKHGIDHATFASILNKLVSKGINISKGTIVDSKIITAQGKKSNPEKRRDKDAKFTKKHGKSYFGYKMHTMVDKDNKLILNTHFTPANAADITQLETLINQTSKVSKIKDVYGDRAYDSISLTSMYLSSRGIRLKTLRKKDTLERKDRFSTDVRKLCELPQEMLAKIRARIEHVFGRLVNEFNLVKARFYDIRSNEFFYTMQMAILNVKTAFKLLGL